VLRYDVAVLTLSRPVTYAPHISPICLPEAGRDPEPGTTAYVAGWGALIPDDVSGPLIQFLVPEIKRPSVLQVVNVPVLENYRCETWHRNSGIKVRLVINENKFLKWICRCTFGPKWFAPVIGKEAKTRARVTAEDL